MTRVCIFLEKAETKFGCLFVICVTCYVFISHLHHTHEMLGTIGRCIEQRRRRDAKVAVEAQKERPSRYANNGVEPKPEVMWETQNLQSNFSLIQGDDKTKVELHIHNASPFDNGKLKCVARSVAGKIINKTRLNIACK